MQGVDSLYNNSNSKTMQKSFNKYFDNTMIHLQKAFYYIPLERRQTQLPE